MSPPASAYDSSEGRGLVQEIMRENEPPIELHDYQLEGICRMLDGEDVLATLATGAGKSGLFTFLMIAVREIGKNPSRALALGLRTFPENPCMLVLCPTKALEYDLASKMDTFGISPLVINEDTLKEARAGNESLWKQAAEKPMVILMSPEVLKSKEFDHLRQDNTFKRRFCMFGVDEAHLVRHWGTTFRNKFLEIAKVRALFPMRADGTRIPCIGLTATLRAGVVMQTVVTALDFRHGQYHIIRHSNMRHNIQIIFRKLRSSLNQTLSPSFPELDWLISSSSNCVIFCKTIKLVDVVVDYLHRIAREKGEESPENRIRSYTSLSWQDFNNKTTHHLANDQQSTVIVATDVLSVGWDSDVIDVVVILGELNDIDEFVQKAGRGGRGRTGPKVAQAIWYYPNSMLEKANLAKATSSGVKPPRKLVPGGDVPELAEGSMDEALVALLTGTCIVDTISSAYENPDSDPICSCRRCTENPPIPRKIPCNCSRCLPEVEIELPKTRKPKRGGQKVRAKKGQGISKNMRNHGLARFEELREDMFNRKNTPDENYYVLEQFLPQVVIDFAITNVYSIHSIDNLTGIVSGTMLEGATKDLEEVLQYCLDLRHDFDRIREEERINRAATKELKERHQLGAAESSSSSETSEGDNETRDHRFVIIMNSKERRVQMIEKQD